MTNQPASMFYSLAGKIAFVTGAGQGIGAGIARRLAQAGARVGVFDINAQSAARIAEDCGGLALTGNVTSAEDIAQALANLKSNFGDPDIVVNNAGIIGPVTSSLETSQADFESILAVNVIGPFLVSRAVLPGMLARKYGRIINIASVAGKEGAPGMLPYGVSKAGLISMTKTMAKESVRQGDITINCISPGVIHTPMMEAGAKEVVDAIIALVPMGRAGTIAEVAALVHFLASQEASFTTGQCYDISGGLSSY